MVLFIQCASHPPQRKSHSYSPSPSSCSCRYAKAFFILSISIRVAFFRQASSKQTWFPGKHCHSHQLVSTFDSFKLFETQPNLLAFSILLFNFTFFIFLSSVLEFSFVFILYSVFLFVCLFVCSNLSPLHLCLPFFLIYAIFTQLNTKWDVALCKRICLITKSMLKIFLVLKYRHLKREKQTTAHYSERFLLVFFFLYISFFFLFSSICFLLYSPRFSLFLFVYFKVLPPTFHCRRKK